MNNNLIIDSKFGNTSSSQPSEQMDKKSKQGMLRTIFNIS